jgi:hypothetical protein
MEEKDLTGEESLQLINRMIHEAKGYFAESGVSVILYGFSILICTMLAYLLEKNFISFPFNPFLLMIPVFFIQAWIHYREDKKKKAKTFTDEAIDYVWTGQLLAVLAALCGNFAHAGYIIVTMILLVSGFATFVTGAIAKFRYAIVSGIICLLIAAVSFFVQNENIYLLLALVSVIVVIIPGFILRAYYKKLQHGK